jgi:tRNA threonylcarbamoyladenosine biosynthesis protein TsaE
MDIRVGSIGELDEIAVLLIRYFDEGYKIILLSGDLGAGKTTLVQVLCKHLGITEPVSSPTFSLVNEYFSPSMGPVYHMDFYRLEKTEDLVQIGLEEYLDSGQPCLIEWPGIAEPYFGMPHVRVHIRVEPNNIRIFNITTHDAVDA